jgi:hypothetical protein
VKPTDEDIARLVATSEKVLLWLERLATQARNQAKQNEGRFQSLADANNADARNYASVASDIQDALKPFRKGGE